MSQGPIEYEEIIEGLKATIAQREKDFDIAIHKLNDRQSLIDKQQAEINHMRPLLRQSWHLLSLIEIEAQRRIPSFSLLDFVRRSIEDIKSFFFPTAG